jgi:hypothetical protein
VAAQEIRDREIAAAAEEEAREKDTAAATLCMEEAAVADRRALIEQGTRQFESLLQGVGS